MMKRFINTSSRLIMLAVIITFTLAGAGCKSKKKAMEKANADAEKARIEQEAALRKQRQEEETRRMEAEERARQEREAQAQQQAAPSQKLEQYFRAIATSGSTASANSSIDEAMALFASPDTPVLIVISESGGQKDYDRPTTIKDYLNYLKDQKKNINRVSNLQFNSAGKITEVELVK